MMAGRIFSARSPLGKSAALCLCLLISSPAPSAPAASSAFVIPESLGRIERFYQGSSRKTFYFIQDAHDSLEAQENIARLIGHLVEQKNIRQVWEEGYEGKVPTEEYFGKISGAEERERVAYYLLDQLRIGAAEYAHITRKQNFELLGIDDRRLHRENVEWYQRSEQVREQVAGELKGFKAELEARAARRFPKEFWDWRKRAESFHQGQLGLLDYLERTAEMLPEADRDLGAWPALAGLSKVSRETDLQAGDQGAIEVPSPNEVFQELGHLEETVAGLFLKSEEDLTLHRAADALELELSLARLEVSPEEFETVKGRLKRFDTIALARLFSEGRKKPVVLSRLWERGLDPAIRFYETARARETVLEKHLEALRLKPGAGEILLVYGGFHAAEVERMFRQNNFSYYVISPNISELSRRHQVRYRQMMAAGLDDAAISKNVRTGARPLGDFARMSLNPSLAPAFHSELRQIEQAVREIRKQKAGGESAPELYHRLVTGQLAKRRAGNLQKAELRNDEDGEAELRNLFGAEYRAVRSFFSEGYWIDFQPGDGKSGHVKVLVHHDDPKKFRSFYSAPGKFDIRLDDQGNAQVSGVYPGLPYNQGLGRAFVAISLLMLYGREKIQRPFEIHAIQNFQLARSLERLTGFQVSSLPAAYHRAYRDVAIRGLVPSISGEALARIQLWNDQNRQTVEQRRGELRALTSLQHLDEQRIPPKIYKRYLLQGPPESTYVRPRFLEETLDPSPPKSLRMFQSAMDEIRHQARHYPMIEKLRQTLEKTIVSDVELPGIFFFEQPEAAQRMNIAQVLQISYRRKELVLSKKFLDRANPGDSFQRKRLALYLLTGASLLDLYQRLLEWFDEEEVNQGVFPPIFETIYRKIDQSLREGIMEAELIPMMDLHRTTLQQGFEELQQEDAELKASAYRRIQESEARLREQVRLVDRIFSSWDGSLEEAELTRNSAAAAKQIQTSKILAVKAAEGASAQQSALMALKEIIKRLEEVAYYYDITGQRRKAELIHGDLLRMQKDLQRVDMVGLFPLKAQQEIVYFLLRIGDLAGFERELWALLGADYAPLFYKLTQHSMQETGLRSWLEEALPDMLLKLQLYRIALPGREEQALISRLEKTLVQRMREVRVEKEKQSKFQTDMTAPLTSSSPPDSRKLQKPLLIPVQDSSDIYGFTWERRFDGEDKVQIRIEAFPWRAAGERRTVTGAMHLSLKRDSKGLWHAFADAGQGVWPGSQPFRGAIYAHREVQKKINLAGTLIRLAIRLSAASKAREIDFRQIPKLQLPKAKGLPDDSLIMPLEKNPILEEPVLLRPRTLRRGPRTELRAASRKPLTLQSLEAVVREMALPDVEVGGNPQSGFAVSTEKRSAHDGLKRLQRRLEEAYPRYRFRWIQDVRTDQNFAILEIVPPPKRGELRSDEESVWMQEDAGRLYARFAASEGYRQANQQLVVFSGIRKGEVVVDLGTGTGSGAVTAAEAVGDAGKIIGIDNALPMVEEARRAHSEKGSLEFRHGEAQDLQAVVPENVDRVVSFNAMHVLGDLDLLFRAVHSKLPEGKPIAFNSTFFPDAISSEAWEPYEKIGREVIRILQERYGKRKDLGRRIKAVFPSVQDYRAAAEEAGFKNIRTETQSFELSLQAVRDFFRIPGLANTMLPSGLSDLEKQEILDEAFAAVARQGVTSLRRNWFYFYAEKSVRSENRYSDNSFTGQLQQLLTDSERMVAQASLLLTRFRSARRAALRLQEMGLDGPIHRVLADYQRQHLYADDLKDFRVFWRQAKKLYRGYERLSQSTALGDGFVAGEDELTPLFADLGENLGELSDLGSFVYRVRKQTLKAWSRAGRRGELRSDDAEGSPEEDPLVEKLIERLAALGNQLDGNRMRSQDIQRIGWGNRLRIVHERLDFVRQAIRERDFFAARQSLKRILSDFGSIALFERAAETVVEILNLMTVSKSELRAAPSYELRKTAQSLDRHYIIVTELATFEALSPAQREEFYKLFEMYRGTSRVEFIFPMSDDRALTPALQELMRFRDRYAHVKIPINPSALNLGGRRVVRVDREGVPEKFAALLKQAPADDLFRIRYRGTNGESGLLLAALWLLNSGQEELVREKDGFSEVPASLAGSIQQVLQGYYYLAQSA